jgi:GT2 family glycosyltransferase
VSVSIAIVVLTYNREPLLRRCVAEVLDRCSPATTEIVIWNNGSTDATAGFLASLAGDRRVNIVNSPVNVGVVAYSRAFELTSAPYLVQLDDDVVSAPPEWDAALLKALQDMPGYGYLAADIEDSGDRLSQERHRVHDYQEIVVGGHRILDGPTGGWCTITSRAVYDQVGGLPKRSRLKYFREDEVYVGKVSRAGYRYGILRDLVVRHAGDPVGAPPNAEKAILFARDRARVRRKNAVKRLLLAVPGLRSANNRHQWFREP